MPPRGGRSAEGPPKRDSGEREVLFLKTWSPLFDDDPRLGGVQPFICPAYPTTMHFVVPFPQYLLVSIDSFCWTSYRVPLGPHRVTQRPVFSQGLLSGMRPPGGFRIPIKGVHGVTKVARFLAKTQPIERWREGVGARVLRRLCVSQYLAPRCLWMIVLMPNSFPNATGRR